MPRFNPGAEGSFSVAPLDRLGSPGQHLAHADALQHLTAVPGVALFHDVLQAKRERVHPKLLRDRIGVRFDREHRLRSGRAAVRAERDVVGVDDEHFDLEVGDPVRPRGQHRSDRRQQRAAAGVRARIHHRFRLAPEDRAVVRDRAADRDDHRVARVAGAELLLAAVDHLHRAAGRARQHPGVHLDRRFQLGAEPAPDRLRDDPEVAIGHPQRLVELVADVERSLGGGVDRQPALGIDFRDRRARLHRHLMNGVGGVGALDHVRGGRERAPRRRRARAVPARRRCRTGSAPPARRSC